jgi:shikimate kinase
MLIFLIGMMGSGKTTIGKLLAEELSLPFFDTDEILTSIEGKSVSEIFSHKGEEYFRNLEKELIDNWKISDGIVATGGGLPCFHDLMDKLNERGKTIFLVTSTDIITERISHDNNRPLVAGKSPAQIKKAINDLIKIRKVFYSKASIKVKTDVEPKEIVRRIIRNLYK